MKTIFNERTRPLYHGLDPFSFEIIENSSEGVDLRLSTKVVKALNLDNYYFVKIGVDEDSIQFEQTHVEEGSFHVSHNEDVVFICSKRLVESIFKHF